MGKGAPKGPSEVQIQAQSDLESQRVRYEDEKRRFIENVASYELLASEAMRARGSSFQVQDMPVIADNRSAPMAFDPTFDPTSLTGAAQSEFNKNNSWYWAPNLGIDKPENFGSAPRRGRGSTFWDFAHNPFGVNIPSPPGSRRRR